MSVKDVQNYYKEISKQYYDMLDEIKDFEQEAMNGMFEPERLDAIKQTIEPLKANYQRISYIIFLLNKPTRKEKEKSYIKRNKKLLAQIDNAKQEVEQENKQAINNLSKV